jgi:putative ABC transport system permease protein
MQTLWQDIRYAARMLMKNPGFTAVAVLTLALGIGVNAANFSVINSMLLRPLPFRDLDRLVAVWERIPTQGVERNEVSPANFLDWRAQSHAFEHISAYAGWDVNLSGVKTPERLQGFLVSADLFETLGAHPMLGRWFLPEEDEYGKAQVVILSHSVWQQRLGSDPQIVGKSLTLNGIPRTVVGVMPAGFNFPFGGDVWAPLAFSPERAARRQSHYLLVVGRLKPGVSRQQAQAEMSTITAGLAGRFPDSNAGRDAKVMPLLDSNVSDTRAPLLVLFCAVGFVLLIACANVVNLLLMRTAKRNREFAIRAALGAGRVRLVRQLLAESVLLSALGGTIGALFAFWALGIEIAAIPAELSRQIPGWNEIGVDRHVLFYTAAISLVTGILVGLAPALRASKADLNEALKQGGHTTVGRNRLSSSIVVGEVALSVILLAGAGLMMRSLLHLNQLDPGFDPGHLLTMSLSLRSAKYSTNQKIANFYEELLQRVGSLPGVDSAAVVNLIPLFFANQTEYFRIDGRPDPPPGQELEANYRNCSAGYFRTMGIRLRSGRVLSEKDTATSPRVVVINEAFARRYWPNEDAVGKRIRYSGPIEKNPWQTIVGVVGDVRNQLDSEPKPEMYLPLSQEADSNMVLVVRAPPDPSGLAAAVRSQVASIDKDQPVFQVMSMEQVRSQGLLGHRLPGILLGVFAALALVLAAVGIYGVVGYDVSQRTHEIGLRMALGAQRGEVLRLVLGQGMTLVLLGVGIGLPLSLAMMHGLSSLLFGVSSSDPATFAGVFVLLSGVALLACYIPARRAMRVDPMVALRYE